MLLRLQGYEMIWICRKIYTFQIEIKNFRLPSLSSDQPHSAISFALYLGFVLGHLPLFLACFTLHSLLIDQLSHFWVCTQEGARLVTFRCWAEPSFRPSHWLAASPLQQAITPAHLCHVCHLLREQTLASAGRWNQNLSWKRLWNRQLSCFNLCICF